MSNVMQANFQTSRTEPSTSDQAEAADKKKVLIISQTKGMLEMVSLALDVDDAVTVAEDRRDLADIASDPATDLGDCHIIVFEAHPGNDQELQALVEIGAKAGPGTRYLAMTVDPITLAYAKQLMDIGVDEVLPIQAVRPELRHAVDIGDEVKGVAVRSGRDLRNGAIVAVSQTRGGIGASTVALNLAYALSDTGKGRNQRDPKRVAVVELDFQNGNLAASIDVEETGVFLDLLKNGSLPDDKFIREALVSYDGRFDVLPSPVAFAPLDCMTPEMMSLLLSELRLAYDYVILDMPRTLVKWIEPILERADQMLIVTDTSVASIRQARRLIDFYTEDHVSMPIDIIVNKEKKPFSQPESIKEAIRFLERPISHWVPRDTAKVKKAKDLGKPILEVSRRSAIAKPIAQLVSQIEEIYANATRREA